MERSELRLKLARIIHQSWSLAPFDPQHDTEDLASADAVIEAFPQILTTEAADAAS